MLDEFQPGLVVVNEFVPQTLALLNLLGSSITVPCVLVAHAVWPRSSRAHGSPFHTLLARMDAVLCFSAEVAEWIASFRKDVPVEQTSLACKPLAAPVVPLPMDPQLLFCGRLSAEKGLSTLLDAVDLLAADHPDLKLTIAGEGPMHRDVTDHHGENVTVAGRVPHGRVGQLIDAASVVCIPSLQESFGLVALEAAWRGRPVIASSVGGLSLIVADGETGLLVEPGNAEQLARAIGVMVGNRERMQAMGQAARARAEAWPSWDEHLREASARILAVAEGERRIAHPALD